jgi:hypothetical protein
MIPGLWSAELDVRLFLSSYQGNLSWGLAIQGHLQHSCYFS